VIGSQALTPRARWIGYASAALAVTIFSGWFVVTRFSVTRELRIWDVAALRFGVGALLLAPAILRRGSRPSAAAWGEGFVFALFWGLPFVLSVALGLKLTSAAEAAAITPTLTPVFAGLFAWAFLGERQGSRRWLGFAAIVAGLFCLVAAGAAAHGPPSPAGLAALAAAAAMWAVYTLLFRRSGLSGVQAAALICVWSAGLYLPFYLGFGLSRFGRASLSEVALQTIYQGALMSGVALIAFNRAVSALGAAAATAVIALLPAVAAILAIPVLGETPSAAQDASIAAIALGVLLAARPARIRPLRETSVDPLLFPSHAQSREGRPVS
jgi:drug/metabolite transporter (DMT)-like permease